MASSRVILLLLVISIAFSDSCIKFYETTTTTQVPKPCPPNPTYRNEKVNNPVLNPSFSPMGDTILVISCIDSNNNTKSIELDDNKIYGNNVLLMCDNHTWTLGQYKTPVYSFDCTNEAPNV